VTTASRSGPARLRGEKVRRPDVLLALGGLVAVAAAVATAVSGSRAGLAVLSIALGLALAGLALGYRVLLRRVESARRAARIARRIERRTRQIARRQNRNVRHVKELQRVLRAQDQRSVRDAHRFRTSLDTLPSDTLRLARVVDKLAQDTIALPGLGDWAITPATLLTVIDDVYARPGPVTILECGSGSSTLFFALALSERGNGGRVVSLESSAAYAEETRRHLRRHGVQGIATVVDAPLVDQVLATGEKRLWYDLAGLPELDKIDVLFVDGPLGATSRLARYPAYPAFRTRLSDGALIVLDDTDRPQEQEILERWRSEATDAAPLVVERTNVRSTFLRTTRVS
jgi:predicted O-methyltransferase YrrM